MSPQGLTLEKSNTELTWGANASELLNIGNPKVSIAGLRHDFFWGPEEIFDGLLCGVTTVLYGGEKLHSLNVDTYLESDGSYDAQYLRVSNHLSKILGAPNSEYINPLHSDLPSLNWIYCGNKIRFYIFDRFGKSCYLNIEPASKISNAKK